MHHGFYGLDGNEKRDHRAAQVDMINEVLDWAREPSDPPPSAALDAGCGIGGSSRHLARAYPGVTVKGITLSPYQAERATQLTSEAGLEDSATFEVLDALETGYPAGKFDLVWSLESGEHMPDKERFVSELARVTKPGGRVIIVTWCHRDLAPGEVGLTDKEERLLRRINRAYYLPRWCSVADYTRLYKEAGLTSVRTADWTDAIRQFWPAVIRSSLSPRSFLGMLRSGPTTVRGALAMLLMVRGYNAGLIKFGLITAVKPTLTEVAEPQS